MRSAEADEAAEEDMAIALPCRDADKEVPPVAARKPGSRRSCNSRPGMMQFARVVLPAQRALMRRTLLLLSAVLGLLVFFYVSVWLWASSRLTSQVERAIADHEAAGGRFEAADLQIGGFPLSLGVAATDVTLVQVDGTLWQAPRLYGRAVLWELDRIHLSAVDGVAVSIPVGGGIPLLAASATHADGTIDHDFGRTAARLTLGFEAVDLQPPQGPVATAATIDITVIGADPQGVSGAADLTVGVDASAIALPQATGIGLGSEIDALGATLSLIGLPPNFRQSGVDHWRRTGGRVDIERLHLRWASLGLDGRGTVTLDETLQPHGRLDTEILGLSQTLAALTRSGTLSAGAAAGIGLSVGFLGGGAGPDGGAPLSIALAERRVTIGPAVLPIELPPITWPRN